jgi:hypothetical protein
MSDGRLKSFEGASRGRALRAMSIHRSRAVLFAARSGLVARPRPGVHQAAPTRRRPRRPTSPIVRSRPTGRIAMPGVRAKETVTRAACHAARGQPSPIPHTLTAHATLRACVHEDDTAVGGAAGVVAVIAWAVGRPARTSIRSWSSGRGYGRWRALRQSWACTSEPWCRHWPKRGHFLATTARARIATGTKPTLVNGIH